MKIAYFDCQFGAAGDMLNAALLAAGADEQWWRRELAKIALNPGAFTAAVGDVMRCQIAAKKVDIRDAHGALFDSNEHEPEPEPEPEPEHAHSHAHSHSHGHGHAHTHEHLQDEQGHEHRSLSEILDLIERSLITAGAKALAARIFKRLARAESKVHGVEPEAVHFHEVGAVDAIVDIVGFAIAYDQLGIEQSFASAVAVGSGKVRSQHGTYPVPGPATVYLLQEAGASIAASNIDFECLTPTGAAILCEVVGQWGGQPGFAAVLASGYGAGTKDPGQWPNVCRVLIGQQGAQASGGRFDHDIVAVLEANLDDLSPQALAFAMERLLAAGALDVSVTPALMKKGRSGHLLTVICRMESRLALEEVLLTQTSTLGVRWREAQRTITRRQFQEIELAPGELIRIKLALDNDGRIVNAQPEYEDCTAYAVRHNLPLKDVLNQALAKYLA